MALKKLADLLPATETNVWFTSSPDSSWQPRRARLSASDQRGYQPRQAAETMTSRLRPIAKQEEPERKSLRILLSEIDARPAFD